MTEGFWRFDAVIRSSFWGDFIMPIREESFRIGCGRYLQGAGMLARLGEEVLRLGTAPLVVSGRNAFRVAGETAESALKGFCNKYEVVIHEGTCNDERAQELAALTKEKGYDVIVGIGGGVMMDFAKLCGHFAHLPVVCVPTSSATCAAYTPLSVRYTPDGKTVGSIHYPYEIDGVIADTAVIATQPVRLLLSGVFDALAKFVEIKQRYTDDLNAEYPIGLDYAYALAKYSYRFLTEKTSSAIADMAAGKITKDFENLVFTTVAATGVISGIARGSNQTALGHKFYETTRYLFPEAARPYLHGEIVGVGLLLQNHFNGMVEENESLLAWMRTYNMPMKITDVGIDPSPEIFEKYYTRLVASSAIDENNADELRRLREAMLYLWTL